MERDFDKIVQEVAALEMDYQQQIAALQQQLMEVHGAMEAQDGREREAGDKCGVEYNQWGCDWPDAVAEVVLSLRQQLAAAQNERDEAAKDRDDWITSWRVLQRHNERIESQLATVTAERDALQQLVQQYERGVADSRSLNKPATLDAGKEGQGE